MITTDLLHVTAVVSLDGESTRIDLTGLSSLPSVGDEVELNYWHGTKLTFAVDGIRHHIANIGDKMLQQITLSGRAI